MSPGSTDGFTCGGGHGVDGSDLERALGRASDPSQANLDSEIMRRLDAEREAKVSREHAEKVVNEGEAADKRFAEAHPFPLKPLLPYELQAEPSVAQAFDRYKDAWNNWRYRPSLSNGITLDNMRTTFYAEVGRVTMNQRNDR